MICILNSLMVGCCVDNECASSITDKWGMLTLNLRGYTSLQCLVHFINNSLTMKMQIMRAETHGNKYTVLKKNLDGCCDDNECASSTTDK